MSEAQWAALPASREKLERQWDELAGKGIRALSIADPAHPVGLRTLLGDKEPIVPRCQGNLALLRAPGVGFCVSRDATEKGIATARDTARNTHCTALPERQNRDELNHQ